MRLDVWLTINYLFGLWRIGFCWNVFVSLEALFSPVNTHLPRKWRRIVLENFLHPVLIPKQKMRLNSDFAWKLLNLPLCIITFVHSPSSLIDLLPASWPRRYELFSFLAARFQSGSEWAFSPIHIHLSERCINHQQHPQTWKKPSCYFPNQITALSPHKHNGRNVCLFLSYSHDFLSVFLNSSLYDVISL